MRTLEYQAIEQDDGIRLELILKRRLGLSARQIRQLKFLSDGITVNGNRERIVYSVRSGDRIRVTFSEQNRNVQELPFLEKPLHILYEDEDLLVVALISAAGEYGFEQLELEVVTENRRAISLYQKMGFRICGTLPDNMKYKDGTYADVYWMMRKL